jgi:hypothetical protein
MLLEHGDRRRWVEEIAKINQRINDETKGETASRWR